MLLVGFPSRRTTWQFGACAGWRNAYHLAALSGEWQRDWARTETLGALAEVFVQHGGATGIAFAWEMQLLGSAAKRA